MESSVWRRTTGGDTARNPAAACCRSGAPRSLGDPERRGTHAARPQAAAGVAARCLDPSAPAASFWARPVVVASGRLACCGGVCECERARGRRFVPRAVLRAVARQPERMGATRWHRVPHRSYPNAPPALDTARPAVVLFSLPGRVLAGGEGRRAQGLCAGRTTRLAWGSRPPPFSPAGSVEECFWGAEVRVGG